MNDKDQTQNWQRDFQRRVQWAVATANKANVKVTQAGPYTEVKLFGSLVFLPGHCATASSSSPSTSPPDSCFFAPTTAAAAAPARDRRSMDSRQSQAQSAKTRTPEQNHRRHLKKSQKKLKLELNANFDPRTAMFVTLTFRVCQHDFNAAKKQWQSLFKRLKKNVQDVRYIAVPEKHQDGSWHLHLVLDRCLPLYKSGMDSYKQLGVIKGAGGSWEQLWKLGQVHQKKLDGGGNLGASLAKYLLKSAGIPELQNHHGYWRSDNLEQPLVLTGQAAVDKARELQAINAAPIHCYSLNGIAYIGSLDVYEFCTDPKLAMLNKTLWPSRNPAA